MRICPSCGQSNPEDARFCMSCAGPMPQRAAVEEARKTLTVVFCDVVGSTTLGEGLDTESLRSVMARFFREMRRVLERHGGTVEKYIGDAVMAVFGVPVLHEDDAIRAVRAADEMRAVLDELNAELDRTWGVEIGTRIGVNTGEVLVGDPGLGETLAVGDAVNVAARLEQAAVPGEVLLGRDTHSLVREFVTVGEKRSLSLKGKTAPVIAYPLIGVEPGVGQARRLEPPMVGRGRELDRLRAAFDRAVQERSCHVFTVLGSAGVGKSRLAREFVAGLQGEALLLRGRCLPYGEGITFWPVTDIVKEACGITDADLSDTAHSKIQAALAGAEDAELVGARVAALLGLEQTPAVVQETFWAVRRLLEWVHGNEPLVVVFDDIQWAEPTFLDLLEYLAGWSRDTPILIVCLARQDLLELRPGWGTSDPATSSMVLGPLSDPESEQLIVALLDAVPLEPRASARIVEAAEGNPLFVEETLRMLEETGALRRLDDRWSVLRDLTESSVPATIQALLAARLDRLAPEEKTVLSSASVIGKVFWWGAVSELVPDPLRSRVGSHLQTLVRKEMIRPERSTLAGEDAFRFHHILIQDAAYRSLPKERRADLHRRFALWVERNMGQRITEYDEVVGYHLEQAHRYRTELSPIDESTRTVAVHGAERLAAAGRRAMERGDTIAAANLFERASVLYPEDHRDRLAILPDLAEAHMEAGALALAEEVLAEAVQRARLAGDSRLVAHATVFQLLLLESTNPKGLSEVASREVEQVIPVFEALGDELGLARAWRLIGDVHWTRARYASADEALERAIEHARKAGSRWEEAENLGPYTGAGLYGTVPVPDVVRRCEEILDTAKGNRVVEAQVLRTLAPLRAMEGRFDEARRLGRRACEILEDLGLLLRAAYASEAMAFVERLAGDPAAAERELRSGFELVEKLGEQGYLATAAALLAHVTTDQKHLDDAERFIAVSEGAAAEDDVTTQVLLRGARGRLRAARGALEEGERLCREAVALAEQTDDVNMRADVLVDLAEVVGVTYRVVEAIELLEQARSLYRAKGNRVSTELVEGRQRVLRASE